MGQHRITVQQIAAFESYLKREERSAGTIENYLRRVREFTAWLNGEEVDKERAGAWKLHLMSMGRSSGGGQSVFQISGLAGVCGKRAAHPAEIISG